jgi:hypothetical protein
VRSRIVVMGSLLIIALALATGSVLLIGYAAALASLLTIVTLLVRRAIRGRATVSIESPVPRWIEREEREAA